MQEAFERIKQINPSARPISVLFTSPEFSVHTGKQRLKIGQFTVPRGATWVLPNPLPIIAKLFDNAGNQIPPDSDLIIAKRSRLDDHGRGRGGRRAAGREVVGSSVELVSAIFGFAGGLLNWDARRRQTDVAFEALRVEKDSRLVAKPVAFR